jgi:hypothetical protein
MTSVKLFVLLCFLFITILYMIELGFHIAYLNYTNNVSSNSKYHNWWRFFDAKCIEQLYSGLILVILNIILITFNFYLMWVVLRKQFRYFGSQRNLVAGNMILYILYVICSIVWLASSPDF